MGYYDCARLMGCYSFADPLPLLEQGLLFPYDPDAFPGWHLSSFA